MEVKIVSWDYCKQCGQPFWQFGGRGRPRKFCCNACKQKHWREARKRERIRKHWQPQPEY